MRTQRDIFTDIQAFANRYAEPLVGAFVSVVTGCVTAALGGNVITGIQIAASGVGNLILVILQKPIPNARSLTSLQQFGVHSRHCAAFLLTPVLLALLATIVMFVALFGKLIRVKK